MRKPSYAERCIIKTKRLIKELADEIRMGHVYKTIASLWEVLELLLRAITYESKRVTYESPGKLISVFAELFPQVYKPPQPVISALNTLYNLRKKAVHKAVILNEDSVYEAKLSFCNAIHTLLEILEKEGYNMSAIREKVQIICT